jgi:hypothetical protein
MFDPFRMADFDYFLIVDPSDPAESFRFESGPSGEVLSLEYAR